MARFITAQRQSGLAQVLNQLRQRLAETGRKRWVWTVNPSAYAYSGSNPLPATVVMFQDIHIGPNPRLGFGLFLGAAAGHSAPLCRSIASTISNVAEVKPRRCECV